MVFRFTCFDFPSVPTPSVPTEIPNNNNKTKSIYYTAQDDFSETCEKPDGLRVFTYVELTYITRDFDHLSKISEGEFGTIYKGPFYIHNRGIIQVIIKKLKGIYAKGNKQWEEEMKVIGSIDHPNIAQLLGYCVKGNEPSGMQRFLVYEHIGDTSLHDIYMLQWSSRLKVALAVACGLACLHEVMDNQVAFGDFNYSHVHLGLNYFEKLDAVKLSKFGLHQKGLAHVSTEDTGNMEYIAPEHMDGGNLTSKSDVWSYGVFLSELITGKRLLDTNRPTDEQNLIDWVKSYIESERFEEITDPKIDCTYPLKSVQSLCIVANMCLSRKPESRPEMRQIQELVSQLTSQQSETESQAPSLQSLVPTDVQSETANPAQSLQSLVPTDVQHTKSSCLPRICHTKFLNSCFGKRYCCT